MRPKTCASAAERGLPRLATTRTTRILPCVLLAAADAVLLPWGASAAALSTGRPRRAEQDRRLSGEVQP